MQYKRSHKMLTRSQKKRNIGRDKSCLKNSNQKYSTVPCNDAVEVGEVVTMDHGGTSGGQDDDCQRMDYLQVAWLLRDKLNDLVDGNNGEFPELGLRSLLDMATSRNIVSVDPKMLNPVLWRTLPRDLLLLVLARLPWPDITRLSCLSREWRKDMATVNSDINQACHEVSPKFAHLLVNSHDFSVLFYDIKKRTWQYAYYFHLQSPWDGDLLQACHYKWTAVDACDGGLVCFISLWKPTKCNRLCIVVVNLLTRVQHELPPLHYLYLALPAMVQIKVDSHKEGYQVVVADNKSGGHTIEIYDSSTRQWTKAAPPCGSIFGAVHKWSNVGGWCQKVSRISLGAYDFAEGKLELYSEDNPSTGESVIGSVLKKDLMFVLKKQTQMDASHRRRVYQGCCITEYHFQNETKAWVQGKSYECPPTVVEELSAVSLTACDHGFLIVHPHRSFEYHWLLDLSTSEWSNLSAYKVFPQTIKSSMYRAMCRAMCRAFLDVIP